MATEISKTKATTGVIMDTNPMKYKEIIDKENDGLAFIHFTGKPVAFN